MSDRRFELHRQWRGLRGPAFGLQQPALIGQALVGRLTIDDLQRLEDRARLSPGIRLLPLDPSADLAHRFVFRLLDWIGALQRLARLPVSERVHLAVLKRSRNRRGQQVMELAMPAPSAEAATTTIQWAGAQLPLILGESHGQGPELKDPEWLQARLKPHAESGLNRFHIVQAAQRLDIPVFQLNQQVTVLGTGACQRLMTSTLTDRTSYIGVTLVASKSQTAAVLRAAGLPGTQQLAARSADQAVAAAERLGYPVVVKPDDQAHGRGVQANLVRPDQVIEAWSAAKAVSDRVLVERWVDGSTHRLTVFHGRVIRVVRRQAGGVTGDGIHSIQTLLEQQARQALLLPSTGLQGARAVTLDGEALELLQQMGLQPSDVPPAGVHVRLRRRDNINAGGRNVDLPLAAVHPDNLRLAVEAAAILRLDFAGIDLISVDIAHSWLETHAAICEVNAMPQMGVGGDPRIYEKVLSELMDGRHGIPVHVVVCSTDPLLRSKALDECLATAAGADTGVADVSGLWVSGRRVTRPFEQGFDAARALLLRPEVQRAVCLMSVDELVNLGFPVSHVDRLTVDPRCQVETHQPDQLRRALLMMKLLKRSGPMTPVAFDGQPG